jgi:amino acid transporter
MRKTRIKKYVLVFIFVCMAHLIKKRHAKREEERKKGISMSRITNFSGSAAGV